MSAPNFPVELREDLLRLEKMLESLCQDKLQQSEAGRFKILNLACGECFEAESLAALAPSLIKAEESPKVELVGLDLRVAEIARASERCRDTEQAEFRFMAGSGTRLAQSKDFPDAYDLVFIRHQNFYHGAKDWHRLFEQALEKLAPEGKLIITSYFDREHSLAKQAIDRVGGHLLRDMSNGRARKLAFPGKCVDKRLAIFERK